MASGSLNPVVFNFTCCHLLLFEIYVQCPITGLTLAPSKLYLEQCEKKQTYFQNNEFCGPTLRRNGEI